MSNEDDSSSHVMILDLKALQAGQKPDDAAGTRVLNVAATTDADKTAAIDHVPDGTDFPAAPTPSTVAARANLRTHLAGLPNLTDVERETIAQLYPNGWEKGLKQSPNVKNCYFVSALAAARRMKFFPNLVALSTNAQLNQPLRTRLLGSGDGGNLFIDPEKDLGPQILAGRRGIPDQRWDHLTGEIGDQIFEEAYAQRRHSRDDRKSTIVPLESLAYGHADEALKMLFGPYATVLTAQALGDKTLSETSADYLQARDLLRAMSESPNDYCGVASIALKRETPDYITTNDGSPLYYMDHERFFEQGHGYTVIHVDSEKEKVVLANSVDTDNQRKTISFDDFYRYFSTLSVAKLNRDRIKMRFPDYNFNGKNEAPATRDGIYEAPLIPLETYCFEFPQNGELLRIKLREDLFIIVRPIQGKTNEFSAAVCFENALNPHSQPTAVSLGVIRENIEIGDALLRSKSFSGTALEGLLPQHCVLGKCEEGITVRSNSLQAATIVEGDDYTPDEILSTVAQPGKLSEYLPQGGAVRAFNFKEDSSISLNFVGVNGTDENGHPNYEFMQYPLVTLSGNQRATRITVLDENGRSETLATLKPGDSFEIGRASEGNGLDTEHLARIQLTAKLGNDGKLYLHNTPKYATYVS